MNHDPYAAPRAVLAETVPRKKPGMENHIKTARAHFAFAIMVLLGTVAIVYATVRAQAPASAAVASALILGLMAGVHLLVWWGARRRMNWARRVSLVIGFLMLPGFPIGTAIGALLISYGWSEWREPRVYSGSLTEGWPNAERDRIEPTFPASA